MKKSNGFCETLAILLAGFLTPAASADEGFEHCDGLILEDQARCLAETVPETSSLEQRAALLQELAALHSGEGWPVFYLGNVLWGLDPSAALEQYLLAADLFAAAGEVSAEIRTRVNLSTLLGFGQQFAAAADQIEQARLVLESSPNPLDPLDEASLDLAAARLMMLRGEDLETADVLLQGVEESIFEIPEASYTLRRECLRSLGQVTFDQGLYHRAESYFDRCLELTIAENDRYEQASATYDKTAAWMAANPPDEDRRDRALAELEANLPLAEELEHREIEGETRLLIAELAGGPEAIDHLQRCLILADAIDFPGLRRRCELALASHQLEADPAKARQLLAGAYETGLQSDDPWALIQGWAPALRVLWHVGSRDEALAAGESVLSTIEGLRRAQAGSARDRLLSTWSGAYYWLSGRLLEIAEADSGGDELGHAFAVIERHRALHLREILDRDQQPEKALPPDFAARRQDLQRRMTAVYRRLLDPDLETSERSLQLADLEALEREEVELRRQIADLEPERASLPPPPDDLLEQVAASLGEDEALLSFQVAAWEGYDRRFAGGSWVVTVTRDGARAHRLLPERAELEERVKFVLGSDWGEYDGPLLARLYEDLLEEALDQLPTGVRRLIVVPDGLLHLLPFAALRASPEAPPLADRFELATVPSAALWLHWKDGESPTSDDALALVMAAPELPAQRQGTSRSRDWELTTGEALGDLPYARSEGEKVVSHLAGASDLLAGAEASEQSLKSADLSRYGVLHFATHAVVHGERPWRSAVVLAAGDDEEDGLLRPTEIAELPLDGKVVVLSTCKSAAGEVLRGEGVISLARAFFEAGARGVVATIRRLPDKEGADFFDDFYCHLSHGLSLRGALAATQRRWIEAGRPASVWASVVVLGNGDLVLAPGGESETCGAGNAGRRFVWLAAAVLSTLLVALTVYFRRQRSNSF